MSLFLLHSCRHTLGKESKIHLLELHFPFKVQNDLEMDLFFLLNITGIYLKFTTPQDSFISGC